MLLCISCHVFWPLRRETSRVDVCIRHLGSSSYRHVVCDGTADIDMLLSCTCYMVLLRNCSGK